MCPEKLGLGLRKLIVNKAKCLSTTQSCSLNNVIGLHDGTALNLLLTAP